MKARLQLKNFPIALFFLISLTATSQISSSVYIDFGRNNVSQGNYIKSVALINYGMRKTTFEGGLQTNIKNNIKAGFSGFTMNASQKITLLKLPFEIKGFYTITNPVGILKETNWGGQIMMFRKHFDLSAGVDFKSFRFSTSTENDPYIKRPGQKIHEVYNIAYSVSYHLNPYSKNWNIRLTITNIDNFSINQETNPEINLTGLFRLRSNVSFYVQGWYEPAGLTNMVPDNFGFYLRTGITWNIN